MQCDRILESRLNCTATCVCALERSRGCVQQRVVHVFVQHAWSSIFQLKRLRDKRDVRVHLLLLLVGVL